jgi:hypothetical protein
VWILFLWDSNHMFVCSSLIPKGTQFEPSYKISLQPGARVYTLESVGDCKYECCWIFYAVPFSNCRCYLDQLQLDYFQSPTVKSAGECCTPKGIILTAVKSNGRRDAVLIDCRVIFTFSSSCDVRFQTREFRRFHFNVRMNAYLLQQPTEQTNCADPYFVVGSN